MKSKIMTVSEAVGGFVSESVSIGVGGENVVGYSKYRSTCYGLMLMSPTLILRFTVIRSLQAQGN